MAKGYKTGGRKKGTPNKTTALLKDAILEAAQQAGGGDLVAYLKVQAEKNPQSFLPLLGKVLPIQMALEANHTHTTISADPLTPEQWAEQFAEESVH